MMINTNNFQSHDPIVHTYSIVARDPLTGKMGVGVQSHWFSVGSVVSWGESGVGVIATQASVNVSFGLRGLELLKKGNTPQEALDLLLSSDEGKDVRQLAILDTEGRVAAHTGTKCIQAAGHKKGKNYSVQANMMLHDTVWPAMADAFEKNNTLPLPERIIEVLKAAQSQGGDIRGKQSAALLIVDIEKKENPWEDPEIDLRVEDHRDPVEELERLLQIHRAYEHMNNGDLALEKNDMKTALYEYSTSQKLIPDNLEMKFWTAVSLANVNNLDEAIPLFKHVFNKDRNWHLLAKRLPDVGFLTLNEEDLQKILNL
jgi:uncharacterized Ntn-hydrolase superfamily protein